MPMQLLSSLLLIGTIQLLAVISPGPDFAFMVKTALSEPRKTALMGALGISLGILVHMTYCVLGVAVIITASPLLFNIVKYMGALYFIYIGLQGVLTKKIKNPSLHPQHSSKPLSNLVILKRGFLCNLLNPKCMLFFIGLFTLIIKPDTPLWVQLLYGIEIFSITLIWFSTLAVIITHPSIKSRIGHLQYYITKLMGVLLILFGVEIAILQHV